MGYITSLGSIRGTYASRVTALKLISTVSCGDRVPTFREVVPNLLNDLT